MIPRLFLAAVTALFCHASTTSAENPFVSTAYAADPSAHVFGGRLYVYPSHDRFDAQEYDMTDYHVYSTDDMVNWRDHGVALDVRDVPWAASHLWAPDCGEKDGTYYFYFPARPATGWQDRAVGLATATEPAGPFIAEPEPITDTTGIDPSVFVDDDGKDYLVWAGNGCEIAELSADMKSLVGEKKRLTGLTSFFEGPWIFKRQGKYYLTYPAFMEGGSGRGGTGQWYDYATADSVTGPYTYRGHYDKSGRGAGNIHGSEVEFQGKWYHFYHDLSFSAGGPKAGFRRSIRCEEIFFDDDGAIETIRWTDAGPSQIRAFDPYRRREAETMAACAPPRDPHAVRTFGKAGETVFVGRIEDGDWTKVGGVDFGDGAGTFKAWTASPKAGGRIEVRLDSPSGPPVTSIDVPATGDWEKFREIAGRVSGASGTHDIYFVFRGNGSGGLFNFDAYEFGRQ